MEVVAVQTMSALLIAFFEDGTARTLSGTGPFPDISSAHFWACSGLGLKTRTCSILRTVQTASS